MPNPRFFCNEYKLAPGAIINLPKDAAIHASRALRMQVGDEAKLFNGDGNDYLCEILSIKKSEVIVKIKLTESVNNEAPHRITLAQAISSGDRMDFTIQKAVEMGITHIQPIASQRSLVKLTGDRAQKRVEHWQNVVISACEQSGRAFVPSVASPISLANWLGTDLTADTRLILSPSATQTIQSLPTPTDEICLLVGAEGGLTEDEIDLAISQHFTPIRLGPRVLRTETAALAALATIQTIWGDFVK